MFKQKNARNQCRNYEARLEDYLHGVDDPALSEHMELCAGCRDAVEDSRLGGLLLREALEPAGGPHSLFLSGVMAKIQEEKTRRESPAAFWNPLEFLASRLSLTAALVLLALSVYLAGFTPHKGPNFASPPQTELTATDFPQPPGDPDSNEEVLQSLVERDYGR